jgi:hypothetical protein
MTGFMVVDGAVQQGLSTIGILLILILFTSYFLLMFVYSHCCAYPASRYL